MMAFGTEVKTGRTERFILRIECRNVVIKGFRDGGYEGG